MERNDDRVRNTRRGGERFKFEIAILKMRETDYRKAIVLKSCSGNSH